MDGTQLCISKQTGEVGLRCLLEGHDGMVLSDFSQQPLEEKLSDEQLSALLISVDFLESHNAFLVLVWLPSTA